MLVTFLIFTATACQSHSLPRQQTYPSDWWKEVPKDQAASWEILPQEALPGEVILSKRTELGIFSNFAPTPFVYRGKSYASVEGFWQMLKYPEGPDDERLKDKSIQWKHTRDEVGQMTAYQAKAAGNLANQNMKKLGIDWVTFEKQKIQYLENSKSVFYQLIYDVEKAKLEQNPEVERLLRLTGDLKLRPDHKQGANSPPAWKYHEIWMEIRQGLK